MTLAPVSSVLSEFTGGDQPEIAMMIGVGVVKESDAVFFQYLGGEEKPRALMLPTSGRPLTYLKNVRLVDIGIEEEVGEFKSTKLNLFLESSAGNTVMLTSGLNTLWSQCVMTALMGLWNSYDLETAFTLNSWKGTSKMKPCFASIKIGQAKVSDTDMYNQLVELRGDRAKDKIEAVMRDSVEILKAALKTDSEVQPVEVQEVEELAGTNDF